MIGTKTESHVKKKLKESIFQDLHASMKPNNDLKIDNNNEIMEVNIEYCRVGTHMFSVINLFFLKNFRLILMMNQQWPELSETLAKIRVMTMERRK